MPRRAHLGWSAPLLPEYCLAVCGNNHPLSFARSVFRTDRSSTSWVKDRTVHPSQQTTLEKGGRLRMTLTVAATPELVGWLLGFGGGVTILRPSDLKAAVRTAAERSLHRT